MTDRFVVQLTAGQLTVLAGMYLLVIAGSVAATAYWTRRRR